ncbi:MAG: hypothetical protein HDS35_07890 [Bacteroides sp.]|nr:hypothetical protein [Bacteroides sp.]
MMKSIFLTAILFLITISATVKAADKSCHAALPYFHTVTTADGLPSNKVTSVCRDSIGFIWIGTDHGSQLTSNVYTNYWFFQF